jgi:hypothetical protein
LITTNNAPEKEPDEQPQKQSLQRALRTISGLPSPA